MSATTVFNANTGERVTLACCAGLMGVLGAFVAAVGIATLFSNAVAGGLVLVSAAVIVAVLWLILGETLAAFRLRIEVDRDRLRLKLPRRRGHVMLAKVERDIPLTDIAAIESRVEVFQQLGVAAIQRAFRLTLADGSAIDLGADRQMKPPLFERAADALAARVNKPIRDRGMVDGGPGFLAVVGTSVPDWSQPSLAAPEIERRHAAAARALKIMAVSATLFMLVRLIARR